MSKAKILIIDDDRDINNLFKIYLEHDDFQIDSYTDPVDALYYFKKDMNSPSDYYMKLNLLTWIWLLTIINLNDVLNFSNKFLIIKAKYNLVYLQ